MNKIMPLVIDVINGIFYKNYRNLRHPLKR
nr:MAG TPA: hypothetical protein [Caudoviricetes sp.]